MEAGGARDPASRDRGRALLPSCYPTVTAREQNQLSSRIVVSAAHQPPRRVLVLSDIHANLEALTAVLDAAQGTFDTLWNLGDSVGYGGSPNEVLDRIQPLAQLNVRGNHDRVCCGLTPATHFNPVAREAAMWTRAVLTPEHLAWLREIPQGPLHPIEPTESEPGVTCAHGSPLNEDLYILSMREAWAPLQQLRTAVHLLRSYPHLRADSHSADQNWHELQPRLAARSGHAFWTLPLNPGTRHLINPGSVGQPRDNDWACGLCPVRHGGPHADLSPRSL